MANLHSQEVIDLAGRIMQRAAKTKEYQEGFISGIKARIRLGMVVTVDDKKTYVRAANTLARTAK